MTTLHPARILALLGCLFGLLASSLGLQAATPPALSVKVEQLEFLPSEDGVQVSLEVTLSNNTPGPLSFALFSVMAEAADKKHVAVQFQLPATSSPAPQPGQKASSNDRRSPFQFFRFEQPLAPGASTSAKLTVVFPKHFSPEKLEAFGISAFQVGDHTATLELLGNPIVPLPERQRFAVEQSLAHGKRFRYLGEAGQWEPAFSTDLLTQERLAQLPVAAEEAQAVGGPTFKSRQVSGQQARVIIKNAAHQEITVNVDGSGKARTETLQSGQEKTLELTPGLYSFFASSPGVLPASGTKSWTPGTEYSWTFTIVTQAY